MSNFNFKLDPERIGELADEYSLLDFERAITDLCFFSWSYAKPADYAPDYRLLNQLVQMLRAMETPKPRKKMQAEAKTLEEATAYIAGLPLQERMVELISLLNLLERLLSSAGAADTKAKKQ